MAAPDGHDMPRLIDELVPGLAAMIDDVVVECEDPVREPVVAHELPDVFDWVEFRTLAGRAMMLIFGGTSSLSVVCQPA